MRSTLKTTLLCRLMCCALLLPACAVGEAAPFVTQAPQTAEQATVPQAAAATITALGSAEASLTADIAVLTVGVNATEATVTEAQAVAAGKLDALRTALEPLGVGRESVYTSFYNVASIYNYQYGKLGDTENLSGYKVESDVTIYVRDAGKVGEVIDAALQNGAESSYELTFESSQRQASYDDAMARAVQSAMRKAQLLAAAAGLEVDQLLSVRELGEAEQATIGASNDAAQAPQAAEHGQLKVNATVEVVYSVK